MHVDYLYREIFNAEFWEFRPLTFLTVVKFVIFDRDYPLILCPLCKSKTLWNMFMILGRNVEQDQMTCRIQE